MPRIHQAFTHTLRPMPVPVLCTAADTVRELLAHPGWALISTCVEAHADKLQDQLLTPSSRKLEDYAALTAELRGLKSMARAAETVIAFAADRERAANEAISAEEQS